MARQFIIDCDAGIDDAVALCIALLDPRFEVLAVTAVEGIVSAERSSLNVQTIIEQLEPMRYPRMGAATSADAAPEVDTRNLHGDDGLGNTEFAVSQLHHQHPSEKIICDVVRSAPGLVSVICLGPLTNLAKAFQRDPELSMLIEKVIISGGSLNCAGDITPVAEFNMFFDPVSARVVFRSPCAKTLVPLEASEKIELPLGCFQELPSAATRAGRLLRHLLGFSFRAHHQHQGTESIHLHGVVTLMAALYPDQFEMEDMAGDVETVGELTMGATIFDRRFCPVWRTNMEVATDLNAAAVKNNIVRGFADAGRRT